MKQAAEEMKNVPSTPSTLSGNVRPSDVEFLGEVAGEGWNGDCAVYAFNSGELLFSLFYISLYGFFIKPTYIESLSNYLMLLQDLFL